MNVNKAFKRILKVVLEADGQTERHIRTVGLMFDGRTERTEGQTEQRMRRLTELLPGSFDTNDDLIIDNNIDY